MARQDAMFHASSPICEGRRQAPAASPTFRAVSTSAKLLEVAVPDFLDRECLRLRAGALYGGGAERCWRRLRPRHARVYHEESFDFDPRCRPPNRTADAAARRRRPLEATRNSRRSTYRVEFAKTRRVIECPDGHRTCSKPRARRALRLPSSCTKGSVRHLQVEAAFPARSTMTHAGGIRQREIDAGMALHLLFQADERPRRRTLNIPLPRCAEEDIETLQPRGRTMIVECRRPAQAAEDQRPDDPQPRSCRRATRPATVRDGKPQERYQLYHEEKAKGRHRPHYVRRLVVGGARTVPAAPWNQISVADDGVVPYFQAILRPCAPARRQADDPADPYGPAHEMGHRELVSDRLPPLPRREPASRTIPKEMEQEDIARVVKGTSRRPRGAVARAASTAARSRRRMGTSSTSSGRLPSTSGATSTVGALANRMRFGIEVLEAMREAAGDDYRHGHPHVGRRDDRRRSERRRIAWRSRAEYAQARDRRLS